MKIVAITGTEVKGCTYNIKNIFLDTLREGNEIKEFYLPKDCPHFCCGCKTCFNIDENKCPHAMDTMNIWSAMMDADLLVFAYPVYCMRTPGQMKALLDHFGVHFMAHRPKKEMFSKKAVIITQSIGAPNNAAQKDVATSLTWLGISDIRKIGFMLMEGANWDQLSDKKRQSITNKTVTLAKRYTQNYKVHKSIKHHILFKVCTLMHKSALKNEVNQSVDTKYWLENGWI
ncbi:MAG: NAD(P)H-dependent oxidoreductase [Lachnospiraceae bacterium]|nr:NAD(P)H-dependent oxidoreductase [Lachnospiraceae bacterium]